MRVRWECWGRRRDRRREGGRSWLHLRGLRESDHDRPAGEVWRVGRDRDLPALRAEPCDVGIGLDILNLEIRLRLEDKADRFSRSREMVLPYRVREVAARLARSAVAP